MYKTDNKEYKISNDTLCSMNWLNKPKSVSIDSFDTLDTVDSYSHTVRSRANSSSSISSNDNTSRNPSIEIDFNADRKQYNFLNVDRKKEYIETNNIEIKKPKKRIRDEDLIPLSKSPSITSILEKIPGLNLNKILKERYSDASNNIVDIKNV